MNTRLKITIPVALFALVAGVLVAQGNERPHSLNVVTDCGATPDDGTNDTAAFRLCANQHPLEMVVPLGVFHVQGPASNDTITFSITKSDTILRGEGTGSHIKLIRDFNGPSNGVRQDRVVGVQTVVGGTEDVERVTIRDLTIDGGMDDKTCVEMKHGPNGEQGQQQHGITIGGAESGPAYVRDVTIQNVNFVGNSGDAIYLYGNAGSIRIANIPITGWCRAGIAMNSSIDCDAHTSQERWDAQEAILVVNKAAENYQAIPWGGVGVHAPRGLRDITVEGNTFRSSTTAQLSGRSIDIEPNAYICDVTIRNNVLDEIEAGGVRRLVIDNNRIVESGIQPAGSIQLVGVEDYRVVNNFIARSAIVSSATTPPVYIRVATDGIIENNTINQYQDIQAIHLSANGALFSKNARIARNTVKYVGPSTVANKFAIRTEGILGKLDIVENDLIGPWQYGALVFGGDDVSFARNTFNVTESGLFLRSEGVAGDTGFIGQLRVMDNRGSSNRVYHVNGLMGGLLDCGNTATGIRSLGGMTPAPCSQAEADFAVQLTDIETRLQALENAGQ